MLHVSEPSRVGVSFKDFRRRKASNTRWNFIHSNVSFVVKKGWICLSLRRSFQLNSYETCNVIKRIHPTICSGYYYLRTPPPRKTSRRNEENSRAAIKFNLTSIYMKRWEEFFPLAHFKLKDRFALISHEARNPTGTYVHWNCRVVNASREGDTTRKNPQHYSVRDLTTRNEATANPRRRCMWRYFERSSDVLDFAAKVEVEEIRI